MCVHEWKYHEEVNKLKKILTLFILILCLGLICTLFISAMNYDYDKTIGGQFQIKEMNIVSNSEQKALIEFNIVPSIKEKFKPQFNILKQNDPIFQGEQKISQSSLGEYIIEIILPNTKLQKKLRSELSLKIINKGNSEQILQNIKVSYPPDDSLMIIYLGCNYYPQTVELKKDGKNFTVLIKR